MLNENVLNPVLGDALGLFLFEFTQKLKTSAMRIDALNTCMAELSKSKLYDVFVQNYYIFMSCLLYRLTVFVVTIWDFFLLQYYLLILFYFFKNGL